MSFHWCDSLHTAVFSPRDHQIELLASAYERNILLCLGHRSSKEFIALKLLQEIGRDVYRHRHSIRHSNISIYLTANRSEMMYTMLKYLTDFKIFQEPIANGREEDEKQECGEPMPLSPAKSNLSISSECNETCTVDANECKIKAPIIDMKQRLHDELLLAVFPSKITEYQVYILHPKSLLTLLRCGKLKMEEIQLLLIDDCHLDAMFQDVLEIFNEFLPSKYMKRKEYCMDDLKILGLAGPLHNAGCALTELPVMLRNLEKKIHCKMETASDIVTVLR